MWQNELMRLWRTQLEMSVGVSLYTYSSFDEWLAERSAKPCVGASEVHVLLPDYCFELGGAPTKTPFELWEEKTKRRKSLHYYHPMSGEQGLREEPRIVEDFAHYTGCVVVQTPNWAVENEAVPYLRVSPDGVLWWDGKAEPKYNDIWVDGDKPRKNELTCIQIKNVGQSRWVPRKSECSTPQVREEIVEAIQAELRSDPRTRWTTKEDYEQHMYTPRHLPRSVLAQTQAEMLAMKTDQEVLVAKIGAWMFKAYVVDRDIELQARIKERVSVFGKLLEPDVSPEEAKAVLGGWV